MGLIVTEQDENLIQPLDEELLPKPVYQPPEPYQSSSSNWDILEAVAVGFEALGDILDIFD
jgi:hypothetical protein